MKSYPIDYDLFDNDEIIQIVEFYQLVEEANMKKVNPQVLSKKHKQYQTIINSKSIERQMEREFEKHFGISVYKTIKKYKKS
ncbi:MAG: UPF0223 family protein [Candidatus Izimaplasma sp.]|nr:UPF0223 family protein [Candidatus Izimaplasma bacterium]